MTAIFPSSPSRRDFLWEAGNGFVGTALAWLLARDGVLAGDAPGLARLPSPHHPPKATSCIFLFMKGGPSQFDTFDPKPELVKRHGSRHDFRASSRITQRASGSLMGSPFRFQRAGQAGTPISELLPHLAGCVDGMAVIRGTCADSTTHGSACIQMNTGFIRNGFPSLGAWTTYGLGSLNADLPGFVVVGQSSVVYGKEQNWSAGFLPSQHQGTVIDVAAPTTPPIRNLASSGRLSLEQQRQQLDFLARLNQRHQEALPLEPDLAARIANYELAYRMQAAAPEAVDFSRETRETLALYGIDSPPTNEFGRKCLLARRLIERGVRFALLFHPVNQGGNNDWDTHNDNDQRVRTMCQATDQPIAALLKDLKQRGLLESTLVVWAGEFGRTPIGGTDARAGRDHHPVSFTTWMAGGGIKGGTVHGSTDELGYDVASGRVHVHDMQATILHLMGLNHERLTYRYQGRDFRLTDVEGHVVREILA